MGGHSCVYVSELEADALNRAGIAKWYGTNRMALVPPNGPDDVWPFLEDDTEDGEYD
jgi:hypothetical protein